MKRLTLVSIALFATSFVIGCERSPTSTDPISSPRFSVVPGNGTWTTKASMPTARAGLGVAAINGLFYVVGGDHGTGDLATLEVYDPSTDTWTTRASMPTGRTGLSVAAVDRCVRALHGRERQRQGPICSRRSGRRVNGILYAVGGSPTFTTVEAYDPASNTWTSKASIPTGRLLGGAAAVNGILYAVGGRNSLTSGFMATVEAYDPASDTWTRKASMPTARRGLGVAAINGILYAVGGQDNSSFLATVEAYDPATNTWTTKASMPTARVGAGVAAINGMLYAIGGFNQSGSLNTVEAYDPSTDTWTTQAPMPTARLGPGVAAINGMLYAAGGFRFGVGFSSEWLATVEVYRP